MNAFLCANLKLSFGEDVFVAVGLCNIRTETRVFIRPTCLEGNNVNVLIMMTIPQPFIARRNGAHFSPNLLGAILVGK